MFGLINLILKKVAPACKTWFNSTKTMEVLKPWGPLQEGGNKPTAKLSPLHALSIHLLTQAGFILLWEVQVTILYS